LAHTNGLPLLFSLSPAGHVVVVAANPRPGCFGAVVEYRGLRLHSRQPFTQIHRPALPSRARADPRRPPRCCCSTPRPRLQRNAASSRNAGRGPVQAGALVVPSRRQCRGARHEMNLLDQAEFAGWSRHEGQRPTPTPRSSLASRARLAGDDNNTVHHRCGPLPGTPPDDRRRSPATSSVARRHGPGDCPAVAPGRLSRAIEPAGDLDRRW